MRKKIEPRFPEVNQKLKRAVLGFGNNARLARESGVSLVTIQKIADGKSRFPWEQTVRAIGEALKRLQPTPIVTMWEPPTQSRAVKPARSPRRKRNHRKPAIAPHLKRRLRRSDLR